jgi:uncharacterized membrane protein YkoI
MDHVMRAFGLVVLAVQSVLAQAIRPPELSSDQRLAALAAATLNFDDALIKASEAVIGGLSIRIELSEQASKPAYFVQTIIASATHYITLDAAEGAVLDQRDGQYNRDAAPLQYLMERPCIGLVPAMQIAEAEYPDMKAYSCEAMVKGQDLIYEVRLAASGDRAKHVVLSASGEVLKAGPPPLPIVK